jgi:hypothetical protein
VAVPTRIRNRFTSTFIFRLSPQSVMRRLPGISPNEKSMPSQETTEEVHQRALERVREFVYQHRIGHFQVECRILEGDRVMGVAVVELEVLFKGRFSDAGLYASPPV